jgi:uncharacterized damage-inducible protein DinB
MKYCAMSLILILCLCVSASAQQANPLTGGTKHLFDLAKGYVIAAVEKMPEEDYSFRAAPEERSFAQFVGHLADANYSLCSVAAGEKPPVALGFENRKASKDDLTRALAGAYAYCDKVFTNMTDAEGAKTVQFTAGGAVQPRPETMPKLSVLEYNNVHNFDHYGNLAVYMRLKGVVPPSSESPATASAPVVERKAISVSSELLDKYVGTYEIQPGNTIVITRVGEQLFGQVPTRGPVPLFAETETRFFARMVDAQIDFVKDDQGVVKSGVFHLLGRDQKFIRK